MIKDTLRYYKNELRNFLVSPKDYAYTKKFIHYMNDKARSIGMSSSKFDTASGASWTAYSTAHDLYILTDIFCSNHLLRSFCETHKAVLNMKEIHNHALDEAAAVFDFPIAVKTGTYGSRNKAVCLSSKSVTICIMSNDKTVFDDIFSTAKTIISGTYIPTDSIGYYGFSDSNKYEYNPDKHFLPASTTKLLTALCAYDVCGLNGTVTVKPIDIALGSGSLYSIGNTFSMSDAVQIMLMESSNTLANAIARTCGPMIYQPR